jgi:hypothetical protein
MSRKVYHLKIEEELLKDEIIAIHTSLEAHQIAFYLNQTMAAKFIRTKKDLFNKKVNPTFIHFEWQNEAYDLNCSLFSNKNLNEKDQLSLNSTSLFDMPLRNEVSLISNFKKVDFFIKSTDRSTIESIITQLKNWSNISLIYQVPLDKIRTQLNLIFN